MITKYCLIIILKPFSDDTGSVYHVNFFFDVAFGFSLNHTYYPYHSVHSIGRCFLETMYPIIFYFIPQLCGSFAFWVGVDEVYDMEFYIFCAVVITFIEMCWYVIFRLLFFDTS